MKKLENRSIWSNEQDVPEQTSWRALKHNKDFEKKAVEAQIEDPNSMYNHYRNMIQARRTEPALISGEIERAFTKQAGLVVFKRSTEKDSVLVLHNLTKENQSFSLHEKENGFSSLFYQSDDQVEIKKGRKTVKIMLPPYSTIILDEN